jgi:hypothetical protein
VRPDVGGIDKSLEGLGEFGHGCASPVGDKLLLFDPASLTKKVFYRSLCASRMLRFVRMYCSLAVTLEQHQQKLRSIQSPRFDVMPLPDMGG